MIDKIIEELERLSYNTDNCDIVVELSDAKRIVENNLNNRWILCSERMPEHCQDVSICIKSDNSYGDGIDIEYINTFAECNLYDPYIKASGADGGFDTITDYDEGQPIEVIAWQPLPREYKED